jgi:transcriptional regulator with XRE-family HTH domain
VRRKTPVDPATRRLAEQVRAFRVAREMSQERLAEESGTHATYVSDLEQGRMAPSFGVVARLAAALRVSVADLYPFIEYPPEDADAGSYPVWCSCRHGRRIKATPDSLSIEPVVCGLCGGKFKAGAADPLPPARRRRRSRWVSAPRAGDG